MGKIGRTPNMPTPGSTMHMKPKWENQVWLYNQAKLHGVSYGQIVDELVEAKRIRNRQYRPERYAEMTETDRLTSEAQRQYKLLKNNPENVAEAIKSMDKARKDAK